MSTNEEEKVDSKEFKEEVESPEIEEEISQVSTNKTRNIILLLIVVVGIVGCIYFFFIKDSDSDSVEEQDIVSTPIELPELKSFNSNDISYVQTQKKTTTVPTLSSIKTRAEQRLEDEKKAQEEKEKREQEQREKEQREKEQKEKEQRDKSELIERELLENSKIATGPQIESLLTPPGAKQKAPDPKTLAEIERRRKAPMILIKNSDSSTESSEGNIKSSVENVDGKFIKPSNMYLTMSKGKHIDAVIENSLNTDFGGNIRAVITSNVYSEWGKNILIPQGSKIFGTYNLGFQDKHGRVFINWNRIDLANGYKITFNEIAADNLGLKGVQGDIDYKVKEQLANAVLLSSFNILVALGLDRIVKPVQFSSDTTTRSLQVEALRKDMNSISKNNPSNPQQAISELCTGVLAKVSSIENLDLSSGAYNDMSNKCKSVQSSPGTSAAQDLSGVIEVFNRGLDSLLILNNQNVEETQAQKASRDAFEDLSDTAEDVLFGTKNWEPTINVDQGAPIRIYINNDYVFPQEIFNSIELERKIF